jgi:hypothetical protein
MRIYCQHCGQHFDIPQEKFPKTERVKFTCPRCGEDNRIDLREFITTPVEATESESKPSQAKEQEDDQVEEDAFPLTSSAALLFGYESGWKEKCQSYLQKKGYCISLTDSVQAASQKMRTSFYHIIILEDIPEADELLHQIGRWPGKIRREVNCLLVGHKESSLQSMYVFFRGVNGYLSLNDLSIEELLEQALQEYVYFYEPWGMAQQRELRVEAPPCQ